MLTCTGAAGAAAATGGTDSAAAAGTGATTGATTCTGRVGILALHVGHDCCLCNHSLKH
jgi:hypothetical protein